METAADITKDVALLLIGIGAGLLPWLLDKAGIRVPRIAVLALGIGAILAMAWGVASLSLIAAPEEWRSRSVSLIASIFSCLAASIISWFVVRAISVNESPAGHRTNLRLRFSGKQEAPIEVHSDNIESWYTLWSPSATVSTNDANMIPLSIIAVPEYWVVVVIFKQRILYRQMVLSFSNPGFPMYEIKKSSNRYVLISISGPIPFGHLELYAAQT
jgi:hypothetical protein